MKKAKAAKARFEEIYKQTARYIYSIAIRDSRSHADAEDLFQETYVALLKELGSGREIENPKSYLTAILKHKAAELYSGRQPDARPLSELLLEYEFDVPDPDDPEISDQLITDELINKLADMLKSKDSTVRTIFYMRFVLELSFPEIAEKMSLPVSSVKSKVYRTLKQFRKHYQEVQK